MKPTTMYRISSPAEISLEEAAERTNWSDGTGGTEGLLIAMVAL